MIYMCEVYEFPMKKKLPYGLERELREFARAYVEMLDSYYDEFCDDCSTEEGTNEIIKLISDTLNYEIALAIYELE